MDNLGYSSSAQRRARVHSLILLGGLLEKAGIVQTFGITLGSDLQKDPLMKTPIAALFKALLKLNDLAKSEQANFSFWAQEGLKAFNKLNKKK